MKEIEQYISMPYGEMMPVVTLSNGYILANFSSNHSFRFEDGNVLPACSNERCERLTLISNETKVHTGNLWIDVKMHYIMSDTVREELVYIINNTGLIDIVIVPRPVLEAIEEGYPEANNSYIQFRGIRMKSRSMKISHMNKFCI